jgi:hypothetical protein
MMPDHSRDRMVCVLPMPRSERWPLVMQIRALPDRWQDLVVFALKETPVAESPALIDRPHSMSFGERGDYCEWPDRAMEASAVRTLARGGEGADGGAASASSVETSCSDPDITSETPKDATPITTKTKKYVSRDEWVKNQESRAQRNCRGPEASQKFWRVGPGRLFTRDITPFNSSARKQ